MYIYNPTVHVQTLFLHDLDFFINKYTKVRKTIFQHFETISKHMDVTEFTAYFVTINCKCPYFMAPPKRDDKIVEQVINIMSLYSCYISSIFHVGQD